MRYAYIEERNLNEFKQKVEFWSKAGFRMIGPAQIAHTPLCDDGYWTIRTATMEKVGD